jgi:hypothetical protein
VSFEYIGSWQFWLAVVVVAVAVNYLWQKFGGKGKVV